MGSSRLLWATLGLPGGAGPWSQGEGLAYPWGCRCLHSRDPPALAAPSSSKVFLILCYVQLKAFREIVSCGSFSFECTEFAVCCMTVAGGPEQALGIGLSRLRAHPREVCRDLILGIPAAGAPPLFRDQVLLGQRVTASSWFERHRTGLPFSNFTLQ